MAQSVKHKRSSVVTNGAPKLPTTQQISVGELAINFADGYETLSTVNSNNEIATFSSDSVLDKKFISSGAVVDAISAVTVVIQEDEYVTAQALNEQNYRITELEETHVYPEDIPTESSIANSGFTKNALTAFTETDPTVPAWAKAANKPSYTASEVGAMATSERNNYLSTATTYFDDVEYDSNTKRINFKKNNSVIDYVDATAFIKDGMVSSVTVSNGNLVVSFNTDAGREDITLGLTQIFNPNNYYDKTTSDGRYLSTATTIPNEESIVNSGFSKGVMVFTSGTGANSIVSVYGDNVASGELSYAEGIAASALSYASHAEGYSTVVGGDYTAHTINPSVNGGSIPGSYGHAEGRGTIANGSNGAHAEGNRTFAHGQGSHAEGNRTGAYGVASHAEGNMASATNIASHAEAQQTLASGQASHAEGYGTVASGDDSHAEGDHTLASAIASHAEGSASTASRRMAHAEGQGAIANGEASHAEGQWTYTENESSHAEGRYSSGTGVSSHAEGASTLAGGDPSHAEGMFSAALGPVSHAEGYSSSALAYTSHAEGYSTIAKNWAEHAAGRYNVSNGDGVEGSETTIGDDDDADRTIYSVGVGLSDDMRKNAIEIMQNGDAYLLGVGSYNGTNYSASTTLQGVINGKLSTGTTLDSIADGTTRKLSNYSLTSHTHSQYASTAHTHTASEVGALSTGATLDNIADGTTRKLSNYSLTSHTHTAAEVGALPSTTEIPTQTSILSSGFTKNGNVQSDWIELDQTADSYILNSPVFSATSDFGPVYGIDTQIIRSEGIKYYFPDADGLWYAGYNENSSDRVIITDGVLENAGIPGGQIGKYSASTELYGLVKIGNFLTGDGGSLSVATGTNSTTVARGDHSHTGMLTGITINGSAATVSNGNANFNIELGGGGSGSGLPTVSASDNGKILQVVDGQWTLVTPTVVYTGNGTPDNVLGNDGDIYLQTS